MSFVANHCGSHSSGSALLQAIRRAASRLRERGNLTPQERANLAACWMPPAVITASLGGHARYGADARW